MAIASPTPPLPLIAVTVSVAPLFVEVGDDHPGTRRREHLGRAAPDARRRARDERDLIREVDRDAHGRDPAGRGRMAAR